MPKNSKTEFESPNQYDHAAISRGITATCKNNISLAISGGTTKKSLLKSLTSEEVSDIGGNHHLPAKRSMNKIH